MLAGQNSNLAAIKHGGAVGYSADARQSASQAFLLKPTGVPVFSPVTSTQSHAKDFQQTTLGFEAQSTLDTLVPQREERTVRAKSFVIGKKVENQAGINLVDLDNMTSSQEKVFPIKVLYVKPTIQKSQIKKREDNQADSFTFNAPGGQDLNKENTLNRANLETITEKSSSFPKQMPIQKDFPKKTGVSELAKVKEEKYRPKSATTQQIQKNQIKHSKLGPNASVKPQVSFIKKVSQSQEPGSKQALVKSEKKRDKSIKKVKEPSPEKPQVEIPFAQNRFQGRFENLTSELVKKAQEVVKQEKLQAQRQKEEQQLKKEKQKQIMEQVKQKNMEVVAKQKEKGSEHIDFRRKEEEMKENQRKEENRQDREKQKELRQKRKEERTLGLEIFNQNAIEDYRRKIREQKEKEEEEQQKTMKMTKVVYKLQTEGKSKPFMHPVNMDIKQYIKDGKQEAEEVDEKQQKIDKKQLLKEQKRKRKQQMLEQAQKQEEEKKKKEDQKRNLELHLKQQVGDLQKKQEFKAKMREEQERLEKEMEEDKKQQKKTKKSKSKPKAQQSSNHKEKLDELKNWIDEQINKEESQSPNRSIIGDGGEGLEPLNQSHTEKIQNIEVKIFDKKADKTGSLNNTSLSMAGASKKSSKGSSKQQSFERHSQQNNQQPAGTQENSMNYGAGGPRNIRIQRNLDMPGNSDINFEDQLKYEARDNRYGIYGDNGYGELIEIKRRDLSKEASRSKSRDGQREQIKLSKEGLVTMIDKIKEFSKAKEQHKEIEKRLQEETLAARRVLIERQRESSIPKRDSSVPGVMNAQQALRQQKLDKAAITVQRYSRGFLARNEVQIKRIDRRYEIEEDIGLQEESVKFASQQNIAQFLTGRLQTKQQKIGASQSLGKRMIEQSQSIQEKIGDSYMQSQSKSAFRESIKESINIRESVHIHESIRESIHLKQSYSQSQQPVQSQSYNQQNQQHAYQPKVQNFFTTNKSDKDPLSLIEIYAKKHAPKVVPSVVKSPLKQDSTVGHTHQQMLNRRRQSQIQEEIEEEIYSEGGLERQSNQTIDEDIVEGSRGMSSGGSSREQVTRLGQKKQVFSYRQSQEESIPEDYLQSMRSRRSPDRGGDSIAEESHLQRSQSRSSHKKRQSQDDSIEEILENEGLDSQSGSYKAKALSQKQQQEEHKKLVLDFEKKLKSDQEKRKGLVNELHQEIKNYEEIEAQTAIVDKVQKIISETQAQNTLVQRLNELEQDKKHKEEVDKIREDHIRLLGQLLLLGGVGGVGGAGTGPQADSEERKQIISNIQKMIEKPIVVEQKHKMFSPPRGSSQQKKGPQIHVEDSIQEEYEDDYLEESKSQSRRLAGSASIQESIYQEDKQENSDSIVEEIEVIGTESKASDLDEDEIKESVYVNGQKLGDKNQTKTAQSKNNQAEGGLSKMRMALGSEEAIRQQSKQTLKTHNQSSNSKTDLKSSGLFEKNSFQDFTNKQFKNVLFDPSSMDNFIQELETVIDARSKDAKSQLKSDLNKNLISPQTYRRKALDLEKWVTNERKDLLTKKQKMLQTAEEMGTYLEKLGQDKKSMIEKIGSPRVPKRLMDSQSSVDFDEIEESDESQRVRQARQQLKKISKQMDTQGEIEEDAKVKELQKKKAAAMKLMQEKEKLIEEGLKSQLKEIEANQVNKMLNLALNIDVENEIQKRMYMAKRAVEESSEQLQEEYSVSARSQSMGAHSHFTQPDEKRKKNVKFASPEKFSSVHSQSSDNASSKYRSSSRGQNIEESIGESIRIEESYNVSQNLNPQQHDTRRSAEKQVKSSVKDSIAESINEEDYSDNFVEQSISDAKSALVQSRNKLAQKTNSSKQEEQDEDDIEYSMNFDESLGQSQQLPNNLQKQGQQKSQVAKVEEDEAEDEDDEQSSRARDQSEEIDEESVVTSSKLVSSSQAPIDAGADGQSQSEDKEVINSAKSVEWVINFEKPVDQLQESHRSNQYSDDFEQLEEDYYDQSVPKSEKPESIEERQSEEEEDEADQDQKDVDELDDLESCPDDIGQSNETNLEDKADKFTDEFLEILLREVRENGDLKLQINLTEEDFKDVFPFNLEEQKKEEAAKPAEKIQPQQPSVQIKKPQPQQTQEELARQKFEADFKKLQGNNKKVEDYLNLLISSIDRKDMIEQIDKPIEVDPLKKLAQIFSQENVHDDTLNDTSQQYSVMPIEFFMKIEDQYKKVHGQPPDDLTESARSTYLNHESVHHRSIFDAFNQALDIERPYKERGQPAPWSKSTRVVKPKLSIPQVEKMIQKAKDRVLGWMRTSAGTRIAPVPPHNPPPPSTDYDSPPAQPPIPPEEERLNQAREEKLGVLMMKELEENEVKWIDYEDEDTQVKFDLADMILEELADELANFMSNLRNK